MKFALINGERHEAQPNLAGKCPACDHSMIAKCGEVNAWHWAHQGRRHCDDWWENEGEWHRTWKGQFPAEWQEVVHHGETGDKHIADIKTDSGWTIEFQRSYLKPEERRSRDAFYRKLVWVVDGARRPTDWAQFAKALESGMPVGRNPSIRRVRGDECRLLKEWSGSPGPIFFDFGPGPWLWWLLARRPGEPGTLSSFPRDGFIQIHHGKGPECARDFDEFTKTIDEIVAPLRTRPGSRY